jgi:Flp pilus assembly pilin Flp
MVRENEMNIRQKSRGPGFTTVEYAMLIAVIVAALVGMQLPLRRAISAKWRESVDSIGGGRQYESRGSHATQVIAD